MDYQEGDERKYFPRVLAALIVIAVAFATFVYSLVKADPGDMQEVLIETIDGEIRVSPGTVGPTHSPSVPIPTSPPPSN